MREVQVNRALVRRLNKLPLTKFVLKEAGSVRGEPDIIGCVDGRTIVAEIKNVKPTASSQGHALQQKRLEEWAASGALAQLLVGAEAVGDFERWIEGLAKDREASIKRIIAEKKIEKRDQSRRFSA